MVGLSNVLLAQEKVKREKLQCYAFFGAHPDDW